VSFDLPLGLPDWPFLKGLPMTFFSASLTEAYDLLAPIYGWFNGGFDTADRKQAKALLDELQ
jgi:hypothetical protein